MKIYVAPGHGIKSSGGFDPGAVSGHEVEHTLARAVITPYAAALRRNGFQVVEEIEPDPDYIGSVSKANASGVDCGDEVHFNAGGGHGVEVLYAPGTNPANRSCAARMCYLISAATGLPNRGAVSRSDLYWLNATHFPALLPEIAFVDGDSTYIDKPGFSAAVAEALCRARCEYAGITYHVGSTPPEPSDKPNCRVFQIAIRTQADGLWGSDTDKHATALISATSFGRHTFPYTISFTQQVIGTTVDGIWGPKSAEALTRTVSSAQKALTEMGFDTKGVDGIWGPNTDSAFMRARTACHI